MCVAVWCVRPCETKTHGDLRGTLCRVPLFRADRAASCAMLLEQNRALGLAPFPNHMPCGYCGIRVGAGQEAAVGLHALATDVMLVPSQQTLHFLVSLLTRVRAKEITSRKPVAHGQPRFQVGTRLSTNKGVQ